MWAPRETSRKTSCSLFSFSFSSLQLRWSSFFFSNRSILINNVSLLLLVVALHTSDKRIESIFFFCFYKEVVESELKLQLLSFSLFFGSTVHCYIGLYKSQEKRRISRLVVVKVVLVSGRFTYERKKRKVIYTRQINR